MRVKGTSKSKKGKLLRITPAGAGKRKEDIINIPRANLYAEYVSTCEEKGEIVNSQVKFYREIEQRYKVKVKNSSVGYVDGVRKRAWVYN